MHLAPGDLDTLNELLLVALQVKMQVISQYDKTLLQN